MYLPLSVFKILRSLGMRERESPGEFCFLNREAVVKAINARFPPTAFQCFETQIRWRTPIGQDAEKAVRQYINTQQAVNSSAINAAWAQSHQPIHQLTFILDFTNFSFVSGGQRYTLNDLQELYPNPKVQPHANLSGIDLSGIRINHCVIRNVSLANANLDGSSLGGLHLENTFLTGASLRNARLGQLRFTNSSFAEVDISGAFLNAVQLDGHCIPGEFTFSEVSYAYLLKALLFSIFRQNGFSEAGSNIKRPHTVFLFNNTSGLSGLRNSRIKHYIEWYDYVFRKLSTFKLLSFNEKFRFSIALIYTKVWGSLSVLAFQGLILNLVFATYYYFNNDKFNHLPPDDFLSSFYFSIVTFVTLGYGDIFPKIGGGQIAVMLEVILGYITLGAFVFLIGQRASART